MNKFCFSRSNQLPLVFRSQKPLIVQSIAYTLQRLMRILCGLPRNYVSSVKKIIFWLCWCFFGSRYCFVCLFVIFLSGIDDWLNTLPRLFNFNLSHHRSWLISIVGIIFFPIVFTIFMRRLLFVTGVSRRRLLLNGRSNFPPWRFGICRRNLVFFIIVLLLHATNTR